MTSPNQKYKRGQAWWYVPTDEKNLPVHAQKGRRPVIIISDDNLNYSGSMFLAVSCTTQFDRNFPTQPMFLMNGRVNVARCEQIVRAGKENLVLYIRMIEPFVMEFVDICLKRALGLAPAFPDTKLLPVILDPEPPKEIHIDPIVTTISKEIESIEYPKEEQTPPPSPPEPPRTTPFIDTLAGKRRVWDDLGKLQLLDDVENMGVMKTAKKYNLTSQTVQNYCSKFRGDLNGPR